MKHPLDYYREMLPAPEPRIEFSGQGEKVNIAHPTTPESPPAISELLFLLSEEGGVLLAEDGAGLSPE